MYPKGIGNESLPEMRLARVLALRIGRFAG